MQCYCSYPIFFYEGHLVITFLVVFVVADVGTTSLPLHILHLNSSMLNITNIFTKVLRRTLGQNKGYKTGVINDPLG